MNERPGLSTRCIHGGGGKGLAGALNRPIHASTTFAFDSTADLLEVVEGRKDAGLYTRYGANPSIRGVEATLASLEEAESALVFTSGMAAEAAAFMSHGRKGILCIGEAYGGTLELLSERLPELGLRTELVPGDELEGLESALREGVGLVFFETPTNPTLSILDIRAIAQTAHRHGARVMVDNTFATPVNQQPLSLQADLVVHSATKYLGGHSDITAGTLMGAHALLEPIAAWRSILGQTPAPETCALLARSLSTLVVRVERQNANAMAIAQAMAQHPRIKRVLYPGLADHSGYTVAARQMRAFGGMVTLDIDGSAVDATRVVDKLRVFAIAPSLGGVESLVSQPVATSHHGLEEAERTRLGITDTMIRLSVGIEDQADLIHDLRQALA